MFAPHLITPLSAQYIVAFVDSPCVLSTWTFDDALFLREILAPLAHKRRELVKYIFQDLFFFHVKGNKMKIRNNFVGEKNNERM